MLPDFVHVVSVRPVEDPRGQFMTVHSGGKVGCPRAVKQAALDAPLRPLGPGAGFTVIPVEAREVVVMGRKNTLRRG